MMLATYDIGGANIKRLAADTRNGLKVLSSDVIYFPLWKKRKNFKGFLQSLKIDADAVAVTMSAELCDCFSSKSEGVEYITSICDSVLGEPFYVTVEGGLVRSRELGGERTKLAAANFVASLAYLEDNYGEGILLDMGSTTTDVVPFKKAERLYAKSDFERLASGQLVYTGLLRTPLCAIASEVPYKKKMVRASSEVFAIAADVYNVLGQCDYTCETPDGRGKSVGDSMRRLARQLCADLEEVEEGELRKICLYFRDAQMGRIYSALREVSSVHGLTKAYVCGIGKEVASLACVKAGLETVLLADVGPAHENLPCLGLAWMMMGKGFA